MSQGTVKWFNDQKGFGFISADDEKDYLIPRVFDKWNIKKKGSK